MFLIKPSKITVDFFTTSSTIDGPTVPDMAVKFIPSWWRDLPKEHLRQDFTAAINMRKCPGFVDYFRQSIMLPMWSDLVVVVDAVGGDGYRYQYADRTSSAEQHPQSQRGSYLPDSMYQHLKLINPWRARTKQDLGWVFSQPTWCFSEPEKLVIPVGVTELSRQHELNINLLVPRAQNEEKTLFINAGHPLVALTPISDKRLTVKRHQVSQQELDKLNNTRVFFFGDSLRKRSLRKIWELKT